MSRVSSNLRWRSPVRVGPGPEQTGVRRGEGVMLQIRAADQISSRLVWDSQAKPGVVQPGPPP